MRPRLLLATVLAATVAAVAALAVWQLGAEAGPEPDPHRAVASAAGAVERLQAGGENAMLATPDEPTRRVVLYLHGFGGSASNPFVLDGLVPITRALLRAGYAVAASDAHGNAWGNDASVAANVALARELAERDLDRRFVLAQSMGGLVGMRLIDELPVAAWQGIYPACDLRSIHRQGAYAESIEDAFGDRAEAALDALSPALPSGPLDGLPMRFYASPQDSVVPKATNTDVCAARLRRRGAEVDVVAARGDHGHPSHFRPAAVVDFFDAAR